MRRDPAHLSAGEWAVLALLAEHATHGFAAARALAPEGDVGQIWALRRPLVYRAIETLTRWDLATPVGTEPSDSGPPRTLVEATDRGRRQVDAWLVEPVAHVRDARSLLLLKLLFLGRRGADAQPLLRAQHRRFAALGATLERRSAEHEGFARTLVLWRLENTAAAVRFVDRLMVANGEMGDGPPVRKP